MGSGSGLAPEKVDLSKLKRHRSPKDQSELDALVSSYKKKMAELQGELSKITPNMRVRFFLCFTFYI